MPTPQRTFYKMGIDTDGFIAPCSIMKNRHEAWMWDKYRETFLGHKPAELSYSPTWWQRILDPLILRHLYFR